MLKIPASFENENSNYITIPCMQKFLKSRNLKMHSRREALLDEIKEYAAINENNEQEVIRWIDKILKEGIKDLYIREIVFSDKTSMLCRDVYLIDKALFEKLYNHQQNNIINVKHISDFSLISYRQENSKFGNTLSLTITRLITQYNKKGNESIIYPIFVDILTDKNIIICRAKPKSDLYYEEISKLDIKHHKTVSTESIVNDVLNLVLSWLKIDGQNHPKFSDYNFRNKLFIMLDKYTFTPKPIQENIDKQKNFINETAKSIFNTFGIPFTSLEDAIDDLLNMSEKYISINWPDKDIFTQDRFAYPLQLKATDDEESKVEQTSANEEPLQSKAIFFDNKKMMQKTKSCDGVKFFYRRQESIYFTKQIKITIRIHKGFCIIKFWDYTEESDMQNVLSDIIDSEK